MSSHQRFCRFIVVILDLIYIEKDYWISILSPMPFCVSAELWPLQCNCATWWEFWSASQKGSECLILLSSFHIYKSNIYLCCHIPQLLLSKRPHAPVFALSLCMCVCMCVQIGKNPSCLAWCFLLPWKYFAGVCPEWDGTIRCPRIHQLEFTTQLFGRQTDSLFILCKATIY